VRREANPDSWERFWWSCEGRGKIYRRRLLAKQGVLGDQRGARANDVGEDTEDGLRDRRKPGRESIRYQAPVNAVRRLASHRGLPAWDIIPGLITWHLRQPAELERAPGPQPAIFRTEFLRQTVA
jgi:hypothetical protein